MIASHMTTLQASPQLQAFVADYPWERGPILAFMLQVARELQPGARVLDVGAGEAPYAELFTQVDYRTTDWEHSVHPGARRADYIGSADNLPVPSTAFDAVINTQVLEHVAEPARVVSELYRVLRPGGRLYISVPLAWELHEEPYDFYRYTSHGLRHLLRTAGFIHVDVCPRNDTFTTLAQLLKNATYVMGRRADGLDPQREVAAHVLRHMADLVASFAPLDTQRIFPLGYTAVAVRPVRVPNARSFAIATSAGELLACPDLLATYATTFDAGDDVTLVIRASDDEIPRVQSLVEGLKIGGSEGPDLLACAPDTVGADSVDALLSRCAASAPFDRLPRYDDTSLGTLREHVNSVL
jgi:SAM-dependent methyltransferase